MAASPEVEGMSTPRRTKRRANGEGSLYKTADGRWRGFAELGWVDGKRQRKYVSAGTQAEARQKLRRIQRDFDAGVVTDDQITVERFLDRWQKINLPGTISGSTLDGYANTIRLHLLPTLGKKKLAQLTVADVDALWASKRAKGYRPNTVRIMRAVLRKALGQAEREGLVPRNVAALSQPARLDQKEGRSLTVEQARSLLDTAKGTRLEAAFLILLSYGLRRGELLGLAWADLDRETRTLAVRQSVKVRTSSRRTDGTYLGGATSRVEVSELKTRRSRRTLFLTPGIVRALDEHAIRQKKERLASPLWVDEGFIFTSTIGTPLDPDNFSKEFRRLSREAGLGEWHPHEARHSAASVMLAQGIPLEVVSEVLGHSSIYITKDVYGHLVEGAKREAAERMAAALGR
jgi:integrase